ncbi:MAG: hypothetical protein PHX07_07530 [Candidatus Marinimicrobia bacterium]|nr:hypothetical protein [Candidatus Neomarinimicrobiota bacterium]MDD4962073.1 hypothetical protein [Candidatus Neomarinimicrobiota bacterium]MDD5710380.1 hypothetical protein [Candidatus Neomarinimicrobiota bacterium]
MTDNTKEDMSFEIIGYVGRPYGLDGKFFVSEARIDAQTLRSLKFLYLGRKDEPEDVLEIRSAEEQGRRICLHLEGLETREAAEQRVHNALFLPRKQAAEYLTAAETEFEFLGYRVLEDKEERGIVSGRMERLSQDILIFTDPKGKQIMVPWVDAFIIKVDRKHKTLHVRLLEGMLDED